MLTKARFGLIAAFCALSAPALAGAPCVDVSVPKAMIAAHNGRWIELTASQWEFMRGIYAMHPATELGLPFGDKAVLAQFSTDGGGMVFFIDGGRACTPLAVPPAVVAMMQDVATDTIAHEQPGL